MDHKTAQEGSGKLTGKKGFRGKEKQMREDNENQSNYTYMKLLKNKCFNFYFFL